MDIMRVCDTTSGRRYKDDTKTADDEGETNRVQEKKLVYI